MSEGLPLSSRRAGSNGDCSLMRSAGGKPTGSIFPTAGLANKRNRCCNSSWGKGSIKNDPDGVAHEKQEAAAASQKKVRRSSGELLGATDEDGLVLPELLAEQGGPHWPRASATTQVLTFGASWDNRSDMNFLNHSVGPSDTTANDSNNNTRTKKKNKSRRRHSDPPPSMGGDRRGTGSSSSQASKRRVCGSMGSAGGRPGGGVGGSRKSTSSSGSSGGGGKTRDSSAFRVWAEPLSFMGQGQNQRPGGRRERDAEESGADLGAGDRTVAAGDAAVQPKGGLFFSPTLNVQNMGLSGSPAPSVESEFWDGGNDVNDHGMGVEQVDPREAVQAALDRLMNSKRPTKPRGLEGDTQLLESLLFSNSSSSILEEGDQAVGVARRVGGSGGKRSRSHRQSRASASSATPNTPANLNNNDDSNNNGNNNNNKNRSRQRQGKSSASSLSTTPRETPQNSQQLGNGDSDQTSPASSLGSLSTPQSGDKYSISPGGGASTALNPSLWKLVERGDTCPFDDCAFTVAALKGTGDIAGGEGGVAGEAGSRGGAGQTGGGGGRKAHQSRCRHFHTLCGCRHTRGALKGLLFQTNQLDKARNHQRKHTAGADSGQVIPSSQEPLSQLSQDTDISNNEHSHGGGHDPFLSQLSEDEANAELDLLLGDGVGLEGEGKGSAEEVGRTGSHGSGGGSGARDGRRTWTDAESDRLREVMEHRGAGDSRKNWSWVAARVGEAGGGRKTPSQCKMRWERILNPGVKKGLWTKHEDQKLKEVAAAMDYKWSTVAKMMGGRTYKQCRERYTNYLRDGLNCGPWSKEEDKLLLEMHDKIGNKWAEIARHFKDRSENMIKNEYMKLSRDASHRRRHATLLGHGHESGDNSGAEGGHDKASKENGKRHTRLSNVSITSSRASEAESPLPTPPRFEHIRPGLGFAQARGVVENGTGGISPEGLSSRRGVMTEGVPAQNGEGSSSAGEYLHLVPKAEEMSI